MANNDNTSCLAQQVNNSISQLHVLFDEIGVPDHERETREAELFTALAKALDEQVCLVNAEKKGMIDEAKKLSTSVRQMERSLDSSKPLTRSMDENDALTISYPLTRSLQALKERHLQVSRLHRERFEQVRKLVEALESYSSHLEPTFVQVALPPTTPNQSVPINFDLSPSYVDQLDAEFTRVYDEYTQRLAAVQALAESIIQLWAELGIPQAQQYDAIVRYYRDAPEQLGLHEKDIHRLQAKRDGLLHEKNDRERRLCDLKAAVEALWVKLEVDEAETKVFANRNRGHGFRQIRAYEEELSRLNELKRQNLHVFVEDARVRLQDLWDALYFCEDEMLDFTPAFSDVYSDALLEAHEREVARLEVLREERAPLLVLVDKHKALIKERNELAASSQDASRLMMRGQKGEKRDPGKLLREEKSLKSIAKELPRVTAEARKVLGLWEEEHSRPFLVFGERYLDELEAEEQKKPAPTTRSRTPAGPPPSSTTASSAAQQAPKSGGGSLGCANSTRSLPSRSTTRTLLPQGTLSQRPKSQAAKPATISGRGSPSKIPARVPLSDLKCGSNSPERPRPMSRPDSRTGPRPAEAVRNGAHLRAPPPKMRHPQSVPELGSPAKLHKSAVLGSVVRPVEPEDVYDDRRRPRPQSVMSHCTQPRHEDDRYCASRYADREAEDEDGNRNENDRYDDRYSERYGNHYATVRGGPYEDVPPRPPRHISNTSSHVSHASTLVSGSENWETYDDISDPEPQPDASATYYSRLRAARGRRHEPEHFARPNKAPQRVRGMPPPSGYTGPVMIDQDGNRTISGSEWTDEDAF